MGVLLRRQAVQMYASAFGEPEPVHYRLSLQYEGHARLCLLAYNRSERRRTAAPGVGTTEAKVGSIALRHPTCEATSCHDAAGDPDHQSTTASPGAGSSVKNLIRAIFGESR